jgi:hypothetical protein
MKVSPTYLKPLKIKFFFRFEHFQNFRKFSIFCTANCTTSPCLSMLLMVSMIKLSYSYLWNFVKKNIFF